VVFGEGFETLHHLFLRFRRRNNIENLLAPGAADFDSCLRDSSIVQVELGETGSAGDDHRAPLFAGFLLLWKNAWEKSRTKVDTAGRYKKGALHSTPLLEKPNERWEEVIFPTVS
jgi:hypothetical protein